MYDIRTKQGNWISLLLRTGFIVFVATIFVGFIQMIYWCLVMVIVLKDLFDGLINLFNGLQ